MGYRLYENYLEKRELSITTNTITMSTRKKGENPRRYKVLKNIVKKDEATALKNALEQLNVQPKALRPAHDEHSFIFIEK